MRIIGLKWLVTLTLFKLLLTANGQLVDTTTTKAVTQPSTTPPAVTTTTPPPVRTTTTTAAVVTTTTLSTLKPVTTTTTTTTLPPITSAPVSTTTTVAPVTTTTPAISVTSPLSSTIDTTSATSPSTTPTNTETNKPKSGNNTAVIVGSVVGGVVGIALIGGIIACINRRGGCTQRTKNKEEYDDYGLGDFPHHKPANAVNMNNANPVSPTIPRLNDQGNYYGNDGYGGHYNQGYMDNNMDYGMQHQQGGYYYPEHQQQQQQYYDEGNYYYDNSTSPTTYAPQQQYSPNMHHAGIPQPYMMNNSVPNVPQHQDVYKPDDIGVNTNSGVNVNVPPHHR